MKFIPCIEPWQNSNIVLAERICEDIGRWRLALAVNLFTVPPIPSHVDFPWQVAKKFHIQSIEKSVR